MSQNVRVWSGDHWRSQCDSCSCRFIDSCGLVGYNRRRFHCTLVAMHKAQTLELGYPADYECAIFMCTDYTANACGQCKQYIPRSLNA